MLFNKFNLVFYFCVNMAIAFFNISSSSFVRFNSFFNFAIFLLLVTLPSSVFIGEYSFTHQRIALLMPYSRTITLAALLFLLYNSTIIFLKSSSYLFFRFSTIDTPLNVFNFITLSNFLCLYIILTPVKLLYFSYNIIYTIVKDF